MRPIVNQSTRIYLEDNPFDLVPTRPLCVAWVMIDPSHVLPHFGGNAVQEEVVDGIQRVREDELRPREDAQLVAHRVEVVPARQLV